MLGIERRGDILALTLARPEVRNAIDRTLRDELVGALRLAAADPTVRAVELRGSGPDFCAGGDLAEFGTTPDPAVAHAVRTTRSLPAAMAACAERATVFTHGAAIGAGVELMAFARRVVATPDAWFCLPELAMGLVPGAGGTASLPRRIGRARTAYLALSGVPLRAAAARRWGLVDELVPAAPTRSP